jgi:hypothetical protein
MRRGDHRRSGAVSEILISSLIWPFAVTACEPNTTTAGTVGRFRGGNLTIDTHVSAAARTLQPSAQWAAGTTQRQRVRRPAAARLSLLEP